MKRKTFLRLSSALAAGSTLSPILSCMPQNETPPSAEALKNWAGNIQYSTSTVFYPETTAEVPQLVRQYPRLKALGTRHCFNRIADSEHVLFSTKYLNKVVSLNENAKTVTVEAGIKYGELAPYLHKRGYALHNLASLPHISVAGACATATHGSGVGNGNLASVVSGLEFVAADGELHSLFREKDGERFQAAVVSLGAIGVITKVRLDIIPTFEVEQRVYIGLPMAELEQSFDQIMSAGYSVSLFMDWKKDQINEVWVKRLVGKDNSRESMQEFYGAQAAERDLHPIIEISAEHCTEQMGVPGPWYERLPHFKMGFTPSSGDELQSEYFVPRNQAVNAIKAVAAMGEQISPHLFISEIRSIQADELWMSTAYQRESVSIHFTWKPEWEAVRQLLPKIEAALEPFEVRPHWGKLFTMPPGRLASRYSKLEDFKAMIAEYDPEGKFRNRFLEEHLYQT